MEKRSLLQRARDWINSTLSKPQRWFVDMMTGGAVSSGAIVNEQTAMTYTAFWASVRAIAKPIASLPLHLYKHDGSGRVRAYDTPLYRLINKQPNPYMGSIAFRDAMTAHLLTWGNGYAEIEYGEDGLPKHLWLLTPDIVTPQLNDNNEIEYLVDLPSGEQVTLPNWKVFHLVGPGFDGLQGYSIIRMFRESIGMGMSVTEYGSRFFGKGAKPGGVLEHPGRLKTKEQIDNLRKQWDDIHKGLDNAHRVAILEEGMQYKQIGIPPEDAQFLETRAFQRQEMASIFGVPPHKIGDLERATFSNIEHQAQEFYNDTLLYWLSLWEQSIDLQILPEYMQGEYYSEFLVDAILRGDIESRYRAYATARQWGWMSINDIRRRENMNPIGEEGDVYLTPLNMVNAKSIDDLDATPSMRSHLRTIDKSTKRQRQIRSAQNRARIAERYRGVFSDAHKRYLKQEIKDIKEAIDKHLSERDAVTFELWLEEYYADNEEIRKHMKPAFLSLAEVIYNEASKEVGEDKEFDEEAKEFMEKYLESFSKRYSGSSEGQLRKVVREAYENNEDPIDEVEVRLAEWEERRPDKVAMNETVQIGGAIAKLAFASLGVTQLRWIAMGSDNCPYCQELDGQVVGIQENFVAKDQTLDSEDGEMNIYKPASHPPLHQGCSCTIVAE